MTKLETAQQKVEDLRKKHSEAKNQIAKCNDDIAQYKALLDIVQEQKCDAKVEALLNIEVDRETSSNNSLIDNDTKEIKKKLQSAIDDLDIYTRAKQVLESKYFPEAYYQFLCAKNDEAVKELDEQLKIFKSAVRPSVANIEAIHSGVQKIDRIRMEFAHINEEKVADFNKYWLRFGDPDIGRVKVRTSQQLADFENTCDYENDSYNNYVCTHILNLFSPAELKRLAMTHIDYLSEELDKHREVLSEGMMLTNYSPQKISDKFIS